MLNLYIQCGPAKCVWSLCCRDQSDQRSISVVARWAGRMVRFVIIIIACSQLPWTLAGRRRRIFSRRRRAPPPDPCQPNPCTQQAHTHCMDRNGAAHCECVNNFKSVISAATHSDVCIPNNPGAAHIHFQQAICLLGLLPYFVLVHIILPLACRFQEPFPVRISSSGRIM